MVFVVALWLVGFADSFRVKVSVSLRYMDLECQSALSWFHCLMSLLRL